MDHSFRSCGRHKGITIFDVGWRAGILELWEHLGRECDHGGYSEGTTGPKAPNVSWDSHKNW